MSIRLRLTVGIVLLLLVAVGVLGAVIVATARTTLIEQVDARVVAAMERFESPGRRGDDDGRAGGDHGSDRAEPGVAPANDRPSGTSGREAATAFLATPGTRGDGDVGADTLFERPIARLVFAPDGTLLDAETSGYADAPDPLPVLPAAAGRDGRGGGQIVTLRSAEGNVAYRAIVERRPDGVAIVTAAPLSSVDAAIGRVMRSVAVAAAAALVIAAFATWWLIREGLRPVDRMVDTAAVIAGGDLTRRVPDADPRTELGRLGAALNEMLHQIERALQARAASEGRLRRFVADAAHELRTPLTSLRGYAELYRQGALASPEAVAGAMGRIEAEGARMSRLVDDLLLLARLDQQRGLEQEPVDLVAVVREATADFAAVDPGRPLDRSLAGEAFVMGDRGRLRQVVDNLLANARTHTPPEPPSASPSGAPGARPSWSSPTRGRGSRRGPRARCSSASGAPIPAAADSGQGSGRGVADVAAP